MPRGRGIHHHPGRLGHDDAGLARRYQQAVTDGVTRTKLEMGADLAEDIRRLGTAGEVCGPDLRRTVDTDRRCEVAEAIEFVDHLHEHFLSSVEVSGGRYLAPKAPGSGAQLLDASIVEYAHG